MRAARDLQKKLTEIEKRIWVTPDTRGIVDDQTLSARVDAAGFPVQSAWGSPTPTTLAYLEQAEAMAKRVFADVNKLFAEDVAAFRSKVAAANIGFLPEQEPITLGE